MTKLWINSEKGSISSSEQHTHSFNIILLDFNQSIRVQQYTVRTQARKRYGVHQI